MIKSPEHGFLRMGRKERNNDGKMGVFKSDT